jgi:exonuclease SbcC
MRLHRLRMSAFLAFPGTETLDFDPLCESGLFLLHGRTGAGKTSILDAIVFAFYGEIAGVRARAQLRSDHASAQVRTEVQLEATLRGRRVRITRSPEQERPKLRGEGTTVETHRIQVVEIGQDGVETVLATRHDEARAELGDLLGMSCEQFCQVVLLPQGGFAKFLHASSDQREGLLRDLFDVGRFLEAERWLKERQREAERTHRLARIVR